MALKRGHLHQGEYKGLLISFLKKDFGLKMKVWKSNTFEMQT